MLLTLEETKKYLVVDYDDHDGDIEKLIVSAEDYLFDAIDNYDLKIKNDRFKRKAIRCSLVMIKECYDNKSLITKENEKIRLMIASMLIQMQYCDYEVVVNE